ncbi:MAG: tripartite ATP-independent transporter DctM subunit [Gammaproteobacteria bacterium]|jgi:tripartite ATP-independent transporter DctM subunit
MELYFLALLVLIMVFALTFGFPVAFSLPGAAILTIVIAASCGFIFEGDTDAYFALGGPNQWLSAGITNFRSLYWNVERDTLIAIPLFVFMGIMLQRSKIAEDLLVAMAQLFGPIPGGLGISVVFVGALLAATTGIVGATVIAMGLISLPAMLRNNYSKSLACGTICASGTLGQIIPPSIVLIILADQLSNAADQAATARHAVYKEATGNFSMPSDFEVVSASAGDMFMGAFIPGLILVGLYMLYILVTAILNPEKAPPVPYEGNFDRSFIGRVLLALIPPLTLIFVVLGSIILGVATVNQAGAIGAIGAMIMGSYRLMEGRPRAYYPAALAIISIFAILILMSLFDLNIKDIQSSADAVGIAMAVIAVIGLIIAIGWAIWRAHTIDNILKGVMMETAKTTSMVFIILIGAAMLTSAFRAFGGEELVREFLTGLPGGFWIQFVVVMAVIFFLGFFLDFIEIAVVVVPIVAPILLADPSANITAVWLGVMIGLNIQTSFLTPPFGFALFYLRGVAPPEVKTTQIYKGAAAFILLQLAGLVIAGAFPSLVNYLPNKTHLTSDTAPPPNNPKLQECLENYVFEDYDEQRKNIIQGIEKMQTANIAYLPEKFQRELQQSYKTAGKSFELVENTRQASRQLKEYSPGYRPLHVKVRRMQSDMYRIEDEIKAHQEERKRLSFGNAEAISSMDDALPLIAALESQHEEIESQIPSEWAEARSQFETLAKAETSAQRQYRRNADDSYEPIRVLRKILAEADRLESQRGSVVALEATIKNDPAELAMENIEAVESTISSFTNLGTVSSKLSRARRALRGDSPDADNALGELALATQILETEFSWRKRAASELSDDLDRYNATIQFTIGMRQQKRLTADQATSIAGCLSEHKDISLHF